LKHPLLSVIAGWEVSLTAPVEVPLFSIKPVSPFTVPALFYTIRVTGSKFRPTTFTGDYFKSRNPWADVRVSEKTLGVWNKIDEALEKNTVVVASKGEEQAKIEVGDRTVYLDFVKKAFACSCPFYSVGEDGKPRRFCKHLIAVVALFPERLAGVRLVADQTDEFKLAIYYALKKWAESGWSFGSVGAES